MTPAQTVALRRVAAAGEPVKVASATAAVLSERWGFIVAAGDRWEITDKGRGYLAADDFERRRFAAREKLTLEARAWAKRVMAWLEAHEMLGFPERYGKHHVVQDYAEHYAACTLAGVEPVPPLGDVAWVEGIVDDAMEVLRDFDAAMERAEARGSSVEVVYKERLSHAKAKPEAAAPRPDGTVDLRAYRLRRGHDVEGGPAA